MTVREFLQEDIEIDVCGSLTDDWLISFVGPYKLTEYGEKYFEPILDNSVSIIRDIETAEVFVDTDEEDALARRLFRYAAGNCSVETYAKLFVEEE